MSVLREVTCLSETQQPDWSDFRLVFPNYCTADGTVLQITPMLYFQHYPLVMDDLYMVLHTHGAQLKPMSLSEAFRWGYVLQATHERLVFRTAYGQVDLAATEVNVHMEHRVKKKKKMHVKCIFQQRCGVPVEVLRATMYSRKGLVMFMIDMVATCSMRRY